MRFITIYLFQARSQDFYKGDYMDVMQDMGGGSGACSPSKFSENRCSEIVSEAIWDRTRAVVAIHKKSGSRSIASNFWLSMRMHLYAS